MLNKIFRKTIGLLLFCLALGTGTQLMAQVISGKVTDKSGDTLPGANVVVKGTTNGTVTDFDGNYRLEVKTSDAVLVISFLGYQTLEIPTQGRLVIDVVLESDVASLDEVVVIGYGTQRRRDLTGSVSSVSAEQLSDVPVSSVAQVLTGRLAGVQITTAEGSPDAEVRIRVRGGGSITQDNSPLYIVDGFPADNINSIAPTDIQSIDVLKDASSTAIYGARGANGVVIITTKSGKAGKTQVSYNFYYGQKYLAKKLDVMSPYEYSLYQYERSRINFMERKSFSERMGEWDQLADLYGDAEATDWQQEVFGQQAPSVYHNISLSGGSEQTTYNLSVTRQSDTGIMINSGFERTNLGFRFDTKATDKLTINFDVKYADTKTLGSGTSDSGTETTNRLRHAVIYRPVNGLSDLLNDPTLGFTDEENWSLSRLIDPVTLINDEYSMKHRTQANFNAALNYKIVEALTWRTDLGYENRVERRDRFYGVSTPLARDYGELPVVRLDNSSQERLRMVNTLTYNYKDIDGVHNLTLLAGHEMIQTNRKNYSQEVRHFPEDVLAKIAIGSMSLGETPLTPSTSEITDRLMSVFGRVNYAYRDNYLASFTLRTDGSSKFGQENRWGVFPSASVAWRISGEDFMLGLSHVVSNMKLRLSYGQAGNDRIPDYLYANLYKVSSSKGYYLNENRTSYFYPSSLANPFLKWETMVTRNAGIDFGLFNDRINGNIDLYQNSTKDLLIEQRIDVTTGYTTQIQNIGQTTNSGVELAFNAYIIDRKDFKFSTNFNISFNRNRVDNLGGMDYFLASSGWSNDVGSDYIVKVGEPVGLMYGFMNDGFYTVDDFDYDQTTGEYVLRPGIANNSQVTTFGFGPGSVKFIDQANPTDIDGNNIDDGNAITFEDDRVVIGNSNPKHIGGMNLMMNYKNIDFSVFLNWVYGNNIYNANKVEFTSGYRTYTNLLNIVNSENRWMTIDGEGNPVTDPVALAELNKDATIWKPTEGRNLFHSWAVEDGSFLRINNVTLGYTLPKNLSETFFISNLRVYATVNNLFVFTNYSGYDPEVDTRRSTPLTPGVDYSAYPRSRMYLFGANITF